MRFTLSGGFPPSRLSLSLNLWYINPKSSRGLSDSFLLRSRKGSSSEVVRSLRISRAHVGIVRGWRFATVLRTPGESGAHTVCVCWHSSWMCISAAASLGDSQLFTSCWIKNRQKGNQSKSPLLSVNYRYNESSLTATRDVNVDPLVSLVKCCLSCF